MHPKLLRCSLAVALLCSAAAPAAHAAGGSIAYSDHDRVWLTTPDGSRHVRVTTGGGYSFASQADDGTIVALRRQRLERMDRRGRLLNPPVPLWLGAGTGMFTGPYYPQVSPDGRLVAYGFGHQETLCDGGGCTGSVQLGTAYTRADRYTEPQALGNIRDWTRPSWLASGGTLQFSPGSGYISETTPNVIRHVPGQPGAGDEDVAHAGRILDDPAARYIQFGALTRRGDKLAGAEGTPPVATRVRLYHVSGLGSLATPPVVTYRCELTGARYESLSWAPDGSALAYEAGGGIYVVAVGDLSSGCPLGTPVRIARGHTPSWGLTGVTGVRRLAVAAVRGQELRSALVHGLRVRVTVPAAGKVSVTAAAGGERVARAAITPRRAGTVALRLRFAAPARARLSARRRVVLTLRASTAGRHRTARVALRRGRR